jgi:MFS family permease
MMGLFIITPVGPLFFFVYVVWGAVAGGLGILSAMMFAQYYGRRSYGSIIGLVGPMQTGALGVGPSLGALLFDFTGTYTTLWLYAVVAYGLAMALILMLRTPRLPQRAYAEGYASDD